MLGQHTAQDTSHLIAAADRELAGLGRGYTALNTAHEMPAEWKQAWEREYQALRAAYADARRPAIEIVTQYRDQPGVRLEVVPLEANYSALRKSLVPLKSLRARLATAGMGTVGFGADPASFPATATVTTTSTGAAGVLNVRNAPSSSGTVMGTLDHLQKVTITGPSVSGFYPISGTGTGGKQFGAGAFASASFITPDPTAIVPGLPTPIDPSSVPSTVPAAPIGSQATVTTAQTGTAGQLNVRQSPSTTGAIVGQFQHGEIVVITGPVVAGFFPVSGLGVNGASVSGYASSQFVTPMAGTQPGPVVPGVTPAPQTPAVQPTPPPGAPTPPPFVPVTPQAAAAPAPNLGQPAPLVKPAATPNAAAVAAIDADAEAHKRLLFTAGGIVTIIGMGWAARKYLKPKKAAATK